jgi:aminomethyltransferase
LQKTLGGKYKMVLDDEKSLIAIQGPQSSKNLEELIPGVNDLSFMSGNWLYSKVQRHS